MSETRAELSKKLWDKFCNIEFNFLLNMMFLLSSRYDLEMHGERERYYYEGAANMLEWLIDEYKLEEKP